MTTVRLTTGQAIINYLANQYVERDGVEHRFFAGLWGIFGHGNIGGRRPGDPAGRRRRFPYYLARNEQAMVHTAVGYAKLKNRLGAFACLTSIGPGATNMVTGRRVRDHQPRPGAAPRGRRLRGARPVAGPPAAGAARRRRTRARTTRSARSSATGTASTGPSRSSRRCPRSCASSPRPPTRAPSSSACRRTSRPTRSTSPSRCSRSGSGRSRATGRTGTLVATAAAWIRESRRPVIFAGGGVRYSEATEALRAFAEQTGIPVAETHAGKGSLPYDHPLSLGGGGRVRDARGQHHRARGRPGDRHRHPVHGLPDRVQDRVPGPGRPVHQHQRRRVRCLQARRGAARRRRTGDPGGAGRRRRRLHHRARVPRPRPGAQPRVGRRGRARLRAQRRRRRSPRARSSARSRPPPMPATSS